MKPIFTVLGALLCSCVAHAGTINVGIIQLLDIGVPQLTIESVTGPGACNAGYTACDVLAFTGTVVVNHDGVSTTDTNVSVIPGTPYTWYLDLGWNIESIVFTGTLSQNSTNQWDSLAAAPANPQNLFFAAPNIAVTLDPVALDYLSNSIATVDILANEQSDIQNVPEPSSFALLSVAAAISATLYRLKARR